MSDEPNYTHKIEFEVEKGTIEWMRNEGFEMKPDNEPDRFAIPVDRLDEFNKRVKKTTIYRKDKSGRFTIKCK